MKLSMNWQVCGLVAVAVAGATAGCRKGEAATQREVVGSQPAGEHLPTSTRQGGQYFPIASYRVGPYAAGGSGLTGGFVDYLQLANIRDGGVNGVKLTWQECETEYVVERGVECYERLKSPLDGSRPGAFLPLSVGIMYALDEKARADKLPLSNLAGRMEAADGRVFPYSFPILLSGHKEMSAIVNYIAQREGGKEHLQGKKIAVLYHGSPYGLATKSLLDLLAEKRGFAITHIEVAHPGTEQQAQWLQIRRLNPDWVILRGWGIMNGVALKTAVKVGYPVDHVVGNVWSDSEEDVTPAGPAAKGYVSETGFSSGRNFDVIRDLEKYVVSAGKSNLEDTKRVGSVYYNVGVAFGIINVEAVRKAQEKFGRRPLDGEELRWGFEHVSFDDARIREVGATGLLPRFSLSCRDHDGNGAFLFQQWDGAKWVIISDWVQPDYEVIRPLVEEASLKYAKEHSVPVRDCDAEERL